MEINGWVVEGKPETRNKRVYVLARCPVCNKQSSRRKDTLITNTSCRDCFLNTRTRGGNRTARARVVRNYQKICAVGRGHAFDLNDEQLEELFQADCYYCGSPPSNEMKYRRSPTNLEIYIYNGIDRVNSSQGYVIDNVVSACSICNRAKGALSHDDFMAWIGRIK